ncbi:hypothetical protein LguiA_028232 [Lonicera macranthoides]
MRAVQNIDVGTIRQGYDGNHKEVQVVGAAKIPFDASYSKVSEASSNNFSTSEEEDESESDTKSKLSQL